MRLETAGRVPGDPARARRLFLDAAAWPEWLPGVRSAKVEPGEGTRTRVELEQSVLGRTSRQTAELEPNETGFVQRRLAGEPRRWDLAWTFSPAPVEGETTVRVVIEADLGIWGVLAPRRVVERAVEELFAEVVAAAARRLREAMLHESATLFARQLPSRFHLRIEEADGTVRVFLDGKRYRAEPQG